MTDPTAWAGYKLPDANSMITNSLLRGAQLGILLREEGRTTEKYDREKDLNIRIDGYKEKVRDAHKQNDIKGVNSALSDLAMLDPEAAEKLGSYYVGLDRTNAVRAAYNLYAAFVSTNKEAQDNLIDQSIDSLDLDTTHPLMQGLLDIKNTPYDEKDNSKRNQKMSYALTIASLMDLFGDHQKDKDGGMSASDSIAAQRLELDRKKHRDKLIEDSIDNIRADRQIDVAEAKERRSKEEWEQNRYKLSPTLTKIYDDDHNAFMGSLSDSRKFKNLATDFENLEKNTKSPLGDEFRKAVGLQEEEGRTGGFPTYLGRMFRKFMGWETERIDGLYAEWEAIRNKIAISNLPPGPASDPDIRLVLRPTPGANANANYIASFLRGMSKLKAIEAAQTKAKLDYIRANQDLAGAEDYWKKNQVKYIAEALGVPEDKVASEMRHKIHEGPLPTREMERYQKLRDNIVKKYGTLRDKFQGDKGPNLSKEEVKARAKSVIEGFKKAKETVDQIDPDGKKGLMQRITEGFIERLDERLLNEFQMRTSTGEVGFINEEGKFEVLFKLPTKTKEKK